MNERITYKFSLIARLFFILLGISIFLFGFAIDGIKFFGTKTTNATFNPIKVSIYKSMMDFNKRYRWKIKYEFTVDGNKYIGCKFLRGGPDNIEFNHEVGYLSSYPKINWLESHTNKGLNFFFFFIIGQFFIWLAFRKNIIYESEISVNINGIYYASNKILPVKGLNTSNYIRFIIEELKNGILRVFSFKLFFFLMYFFIIWYVILLGKNNDNYFNFAKILSTLFYAQAGMHGSIINITGGLIGKIFFISYFILPIIENKGETNYLPGYPQSKGNLYEFISNLGAFFIGFGIAFCLFIFMTADLCREDSIIGFIMFLYCFRAQKNINNPFIGFLNSFVNGKPQNENAARVSILGASIGFLIAFIIIWTSYKDYLNYLNSLSFAAIGIIILFLSLLFKKNENEEVKI